MKSGVIGTQNSSLVRLIILDIQKLCIPIYMAGYTSGDRRQTRGKEGERRKRKKAICNYFSYYVLKGIHYIMFAF